MDTKILRAEIHYERAIRSTDLAVATGDKDAVARAREAEERAFHELLKLKGQAYENSRNV